MFFSIAIDGPGGAGKSSVAAALAARLQVLYLDTGAMYRAFAWQALQDGIDPKDEAALADLAACIRLDVLFSDGRQRVVSNGRDVTDLIRTPQISMAASDCSQYAAVRGLMVHMQRELANRCSMILDGRDIGTRVLPNATLKVYLTASPEIRARRRYQELLAKGQTVAYEDVLADVNRRDHQDSSRAVDPLRPAEDAVTVDTSDMTQEQVVDHIARLLNEKQGRCL